MSMHPDVARNHLVSLTIAFMRRNPSWPEEYCVRYARTTLQEIEETLGRYFSAVEPTSP